MNLNKIFIIHPSRGRPEQAFNAAKNFVENMTGTEFTYVFSLDNDDPKLGRYDDLLPALPFPHIVVKDDNPGACRAVNMAAERLTDEELLVCVGDDIVSPKGWDKALTAFIQTIQAKEFLVLFTDMPNGKRIPVVQVLSAPLYRKLGHVFHPGYISMYGDDDLLATVKALGVIHEWDASNWGHKHPTLDTSVAWDETYERENAPEKYAQGKALFERRKAVNFEIENKLQVTFVVPTIGREMLRRSLASLQDQTQRNWKAIVVDDAPVLSGYDSVLDDKRFSLLRVNGSVPVKEFRQGLVRNVAIEQVNTEWVAFLDDDDCLDERYLEIITPHLRNNDFVMVRMIRDNKEMIPSLNETTPRKYHSGISFAVRKEFLTEHGIQFKAVTSEDGVFTEECLSKGARWYLCDEVAYYIRPRDVFLKGEVGRWKFFKQSPSNLKIGDKIRIRESLAGIGFVYLAGEVITITQERINVFESLLRGGLAELCDSKPVKVRPQSIIDARRKVLIFCPTAPRLEAKTVDCIFNQKNVEYYDVMFTRDNPYEQALGDVFRNCQLNYEKMRTLASTGSYEKVFIVESDMIIPKDALSKLLEVDAPVVSGLYVLRHGSYVPNLMQYSEVSKEVGSSMDWRVIMEKWGTTIPISGGCMGCLLVDVKVFEDFTFLVGHETSHDNALMRHCWQKGFKQMARLDVLCGHKRPDGVVLWPVNNGIGYMKEESK